MSELSVRYLRGHAQAYQNPRYSDSLCLCSGSCAAWQSRGLIGARQPARILLGWKPEPSAPPDPRCMEMDHALIIALRFNGSESIGASVNLEGWSAAGLDPVLHKVACDWLSPNRQLRCNSPRETGDASPDSCPAYLPSRAVPVRIRRPILGAFTRFVG